MAQNESTKTQSVPSTSQPLPYIVNLQQLYLLCSDPTKATTTSEDVQPSTFVGCVRQMLSYAFPSISNHRDQDPFRPASAACLHILSDESLVVSKARITDTQLWLAVQSVMVTQNQCLEALDEYLPVHKMLKILFQFRRETREKLSAGIASTILSVAFTIVAF